MIKLEETHGSLTIHQSVPTFKIESIDIESEYFFLSQFQSLREDKEVKHVQNETV